MTIHMVSITSVSSHAEQRMREHRISLTEVHDAAVDGVCRRQPDGRLEVRGSNGVCFITEASGSVLITVLPRGARPAWRVRTGVGGNRYRRTNDGRRRPPRRDDHRGTRP